jgi:serine/threonine protein kinase
MGVVYLCEHVGMRRKVAVKVLQARRAKDEVALQRFLREARAAAALNHPNVVRALDLGQEGDLHYLSMEYIDGASLTELVRTGGALAPRLLADYLRQAAAGLQHAHEAGLIHRDIRPSNVMIGRDGVVKLLDLGLALFADGEENLTQGAPLGSLGYIAPEQALDGHAVDVRADVYSLGATLHFGLTGRAPNPARGVGDTPVPKMRDGSDFEHLLSIAQRMMAPAPVDRFQSAAEVVEEVTRWLLPEPAALPVAPEPVPEPSPEVPGAGSTDFELRIDDSESESADTASTDFAFEPVRRTTPAPKRVVQSAPETPPPVEPVRALPPPRPRPVEAPEVGWRARFRWPLTLVLALLVGFGASYLIRGSRQTAADALPKLPQRAISPNSP